MNSHRLIFFAFLSAFFVDQIQPQIKIDGTVTDADLNPVSNAHVEIIDENDSTNVYSSNTNDQGYFTISVITGIETNLSQLPQDYIVLSNYPNPFNPTTVIYFELPKADNVEITIYDILGREVLELYNAFHEAGSGQTIWDGRNNWSSQVAAGIYFCRLKTKDNFKVHKMVLLDGGSNSVSYNGIKTTKSNSIQKRLNTNSIFYFSIKVSGNEILTSDFKYLNCSSDTTLNLIVPKILQSATIGPGGGKLETEDFSLIVPEGAFNETVTLKLGIDRDTVSFENETYSKLFRVDGLPEFYFKDLSLKIKLHTQPIDSISFAVGGIDTTFFTKEEFINYDYYSAIDSSGYAVVKLPSPFTNNLGLLKLDNSLSITNSANVKKYFIVLTSPGIVLSSNGNFVIYFPKSKAAFIPEIDEYLESAVDIIKQLGFYKLPLRTDLVESNWPIQVDLLVLEEPIISYFVEGAYLIKNNTSILKHFWKISLNSNFDELFTDEILRRSLGSDVFANFIDQNYLFNSREPKYWFLSSMVFWSEKLFPFDNNYINSCHEYSFTLKNSIDYVKQILGFSSDIQTLNQEINQVLSFIVLVEYLTNYSEKGEKIIFDIYNNILASEVSENPSVDGVIKALNNTENIWWPNFFKEYISGNIYNVQGDNFLKNITKTIEFNDGDTLKYIEETYNDLSAKLFRININSNNIKDNKKLNFKLGPSSLNLDYVKTLVFGISDNKLTFLSEGIDFSVGSLAQYDALLACVVNSGNEPPFLGTNNIDLKISVEKNSEISLDLDINWVTVHITLSADYQNYDGPTTGYFFFDSQEFEKTGELVNKTFSVNWNETFWPVTTTCTGSIEIQLDTASTSGGYKITNFLISEINSSVYSYKGDIRTRKKEIKGSGKNIYSTSYENQILKFDISGNNACDYLDYVISEDRVNDDWWHSLSNWYCENNSYIRIEFQKK